MLAVALFAQVVTAPLAVLKIPEPSTTCGHLARRLLGYQRVGLTKASTAEDVTKAMESAFELSLIHI